MTQTMRRDAHDDVDAYDDGGGGVLTAITIVALSRMERPYPKPQALSSKPIPFNDASSEVPDHRPVEWTSPVKPWAGKKKQVAV